MPIEHVDYPHEPGRLYDCPACEACCHCLPGQTECVFAGPHTPTRPPWEAKTHVSNDSSGV